MIFFPSFLRSTRTWLPVTGGWLLLLTVGVARADTTPVVKGSGKEYVLAHQSSFEPIPAGSRSPFWPIGWTPTATATTQTAVVQQIDVKPENFVVTTISLDAPALAIINGRNYAVGERVPVPGNAAEFVTVKQILDGTVVLDYHGREMRSMTRSSMGRR